MPTYRRLHAAGEARSLNVSADLRDLRDRPYVPSLQPLRLVVIPDAADLNIRDQHDDPACTGFALAAVIDQQCRQMFGLPPRCVSARMLYEMARLHDDLPDDLAPGSTLRGALKGFFHNGVYSLDPDLHAMEYPAPGQPPWNLTADMARRAREITLGAYYRLNHEISDYHAALGEAGALIVSARIHDGWATPGAEIPLSGRILGRHAFAIVGYDQKGFIIQNSWGTSWGGYIDAETRKLPGLARWRYEDWFENVEDAWVLRLAVSAPDAFNIRFARNHAAARDPAAASDTRPRRQNVIGYYLHLDDGNLVSSGRYGQTWNTVTETARILATGRNEPSKPPCEHFVVIAHGALTDADGVARRITAWRKTFQAFGIYPVHVMWETGFNSDVVDVLRELLLKTRARVGSDAAHTDGQLEAMARPLGRRLWRDLKTSAALAFDPATEGGSALRLLMDSAAAPPHPMNIHFVGTSAGSLLLEGVLKAAEDGGHKLASAALMAPACSLAHYDKAIRPRLGTTLAQLRQYILTEARERTDRLDIYGRSLLYLVSAALEATPATPLLGLARDLDAQDEGAMAAWPAAHEVIRAGLASARCDSRSHAGFDHDRWTMNDALSQIVGRAVAEAEGFSDADLAGY
ncbi:C1 family peptidase [Paracoccus tibetensis]|uniref:Papain family cysteine protease n=1 Tax=Paracoccus tibetensis TaxID=336292 RepID=A0A1G5K2H5_9RHOB|nr:C1 family peptidase [Paracoccus tibetensis]SCY94079.1 hypothetical protein SAMN05660710_03597 [Paracoccus tibetensis]